MIFEFKADVGRDMQPNGLVGLMDLFIRKLKVWLRWAKHRRFNGIERMKSM
jgi:hypothetical protein